MPTPVSVHSSVHSSADKPHSRWTELSRPSDSPEQDGEALTAHLNQELRHLKLSALMSETPLDIGREEERLRLAAEDSRRQLRQNWLRRLAHTSRVPAQLELMAGHSPQVSKQLAELCRLIDPDLKMSAEQEVEVMRAECAELSEEERQNLCELAELTLQDLGGEDITGDHEAISRETHYAATLMTVALNGEFPAVPTHQRIYATLERQAKLPLSEAPDLYWGPLESQVNYESSDQLALALLQRCFGLEQAQDFSDRCVTYTRARLHPTLGVRDEHRPRPKWYDEERSPAEELSYSIERSCRFWAMTRPFEATPHPLVVHRNHPEWRERTEEALRRLGASWHPGHPDPDEPGCPWTPEQAFLLSQIA